MANANTPFGLKPVRTGGAPWNGAANVYFHDSGDSVALYIGDCVVATGASTLHTDGNTYMNVVRAATTDVITGVIVGVLPDVATSLPYCAASTSRRLLVVDDPDVIFEAQEIGTGTPLTANDIGLNISISVVAGSAYTGLSGTVLDNATEANTNTLGFRLMGLVNRPDNAVGAYAKWLVRINRHRYVDQVAGL